MSDPGMAEGTLALIDGVRGLLFTALLAGIGIAAMVAGGLAGWLLGLALVALCVVVVVVAVRRARDATSSRRSL